jgi:hypothetical protein
VCSIFALRYADRLAAKIGAREPTVKSTWVARGRGKIS